MRDDKVYTVIIPDADAETILLSRENVPCESIVYTNHCEAHDRFAVSEFHYRRIKPSKTVVTRDGYLVNGIEHFWNQSKRYLQRFNGIPKNSLYSFLKECEWRFNESDPHTLAAQLQDWYQLGPTKS